MSDRSLLDLLHAVMERGRELVGRAPAPTLPTNQIIKLAEALLSGRGEASGVALARELLDAYESLPDERKLGFLKLLAERYGADAARLDRALSNYLEQPDGKMATELHAAAEPLRQELIRRINLAPGGTAGLVKMRDYVLCQ